METKLVSINQASKIFGFPKNKLYDLVHKGKVPYIELENLSGSTRKVINTRTFSDWLDSLSKEQKKI